MNVVYAFSGQSAYVEIIAEMKGPHRFPSSLAAATCVMVVAYFGIGIAGYVSQVNKKSVMHNRKDHTGMITWLLTLLSTLLHGIQSTQKPVLTVRVWYATNSNHQIGCCKFCSSAAAYLITEDACCKSNYIARQSCKTPVLLQLASLDPSACADVSTSWWWYISHIWKVSLPHLSIHNGQHLNLWYPSAGVNCRGHNHFWHGLWLAISNCQWRSPYTSRGAIPSYTKYMEPQYSFTLSQETSCKSWSALYGKLCNPDWAMVKMIDTTRVTSYLAALLFEKTATQSNKKASLLQGCIKYASSIEKFPTALRLEFNRLYWA